MLIQLLHCETRQSISVLQREVGCWWIHNLTHSCTFSSKWNHVHGCLSSGRQKCGSHKGKGLGCKEDVEVFPSQISEAYPSPVWQHGNGSYHAKGWFRPTAFQGGFVFMAGRNIRIHQETNHTSLLFFACLHFQCWMDTLYTMLTFRAIKKQLCGPVRFHYGCLLPTNGSTDIEQKCCQLLLAGVRFSFYCP